MTTPTTRTPVPTEYHDHGGATPPQLAYITDLLRKRVLTERQRTQFDQRMAQLMDAGELTVPKASEIITWLQGRPRQPTGTLAQAQATTQLAAAANHQGDPTVEYVEVQTDKGTRQVGRVVLPDGTRVLAGSYGVDTSDDDRFTNDTSFFKLWIKEGYGKGWGVQLYVSDDTQRVRLAVPTQLDAIRWIAGDPLAAAALFGHEYKRCGVCGRGLTNDDSRARGIGPVCAGNLGL
jgi:hypothetical protein